MSRRKGQNVSMKLKCNKFFIDLYIKCIQISFDLGL